MVVVPLLKLLPKLQTCSVMFCFEIWQHRYNFDLNVCKKRKSFENVVCLFKFYANFLYVVSYFPLTVSTLAETLEKLHTQCVGVLWGVSTV